MKAFLCRVALGTAAMTAAAACPVFTATIINSFPPPVRGGCSNNQAVLCLQDADCGAGNTCSNPAPGARGACSDDATKLCTADTDCVAGRCVNPPPVKPGKCKNNANLRCFGDSDCGGGVCSAPPPLSQGRCSQDRKKGCFEDIDCGGQNKCLPVLRTYAYPQPPDGTSGTIHHSITTAAIGRMALMGVPAYQSVLSN